MMNQRSKRVMLLSLCVFVVSCVSFEAVAAASQLSLPSEKSKANRLGSVVFPVSGNVYPLGYYSVSLNIGNPPKLFDFDIDTGSDLTWVQCDAPCTGCTKPRDSQYRPNHNIVTCLDHLCSALRWPENKPCLDARDQCDYEIEYADHASSFGALVIDEFPLNLTNGCTLRPRLVFGCGYNQQYPGPHPPPPTAGVIGLGRGKVTISTQLRSQGITRNIMGHCLSPKGGGFLFFGDDLVPPSGITWTSMSQKSADKHYMAGPAELLFNWKGTGVKDLKSIFDSGSSYTYFNTKAYQAIIDLTRKDLNRKPLKDAKEDSSLSVCWKDKKPLKSVLDVKNYFKTLTLSFGRSKNNQFHIPPESYLIITKNGNVCLGILNGTEVGLGNYNIIGDISFQGTMVIYDNEKHKIGWVSTNCDRHPNVDRDYKGDFLQSCPANYGVF